jgi:hypothetical protein
MKTFDNYSKAKSLVWLTASLLAALIAGCGGSSYGSGGAATGTLGVSLTDAPACGFDHVYVTVNKVRVHQSSSATDTDAGWSDITLNPAQKIDLLSLNNGALDNLGQTYLPAGHYTQLRMVLDPNTSLNPNANSVVPTGGVEKPLVTPSAVQSGIKLINEFDVASGQRVDLMLDFNACKSIVKAGNSNQYLLKPVIRVIPFALNGIDGFIDPALLVNNNANNVMVTAQQNGVIVQSTAPKTTGEFFLSRLPPGTYDVVITADGHATEVITAVLIASSTSVVNVSDIGTPIALPASGTHTVSGTATLNPTSTTEVAYVAAKQTFGTSPTVTVKFVAADDSTGAYTLALPVDAPLLGPYVTPPITFTAQSGVAAQYTMEASATGYQTQSVNKDISAGDVIQNFTLVP